MIELTQFETSDATPTLTATLVYADREKSRLKIALDSGEDAGIVLAHGTKIRCGDVLSSANGERVRIVAAVEAVTTVTSVDRRSLARLSYHLGNRHVPLQIGDAWVRYERDHVLDDMVAGLGFDPVHEMATFEPEHGAYSQHKRGAAHHHHD